MALKKQNFAEDEIAIFDEACVYKRGEYWQFRLWLPKENKYARKSLRTRSESTAIERGKAAYLEIYGNLQQGKSYFSITTKEGIEKYLSFRKRDVELGHIVSGRLATIATHLQHFLSFIGKDTKLKELERTDCENYFYHRHKATNGNVKQVTVQNEQSTINALMKWLHKNGETHIDGFNFKKLPRLDKGNDAIRRATLTNDEYEALYRAMRTYCAKHNKLDDAELRVRKIVQHYVLVAANSGLRVGEQRQLRWSDVQLERHSANGSGQTLARIHVRAETSKVRTSRTFLCRNGQYFERLREISKPKSSDELVFTTDGDNQITQRTMLYHWHKMIELADIADRETRSRRQKKTMKKDKFLESRDEFAKNLGAPELYDFIDQFSLYAGVHTIGNKLWTYDLFKTTVGIPGDIYEFGCWKGANLMFLAKLNKLFERSSPKQIYGFDNFSGLPEASSSDGTFAQSQAGKYLGNEQQLRKAIELFELEDKVSLIVGDALKTIPKFKSDRKEAICSLAYIDFDLYEPCAAALTFLEETLSVGGLIIFDEAGTKEWPGETLAMKEYLKNTKHNFEMLSNPFSRQPTIAMRRVS